MKVFVTGATGIAGSAAVPALLAAGHEVSAVARGPVKADRLRSQGANPVEVDLFDADAVHQAVTGHEAVVNLATHIPPMSKAARHGAWKENDRIRREVSANLADAALATGVEHLVQESIGFLYADGGDDWIVESSPIDVWFATESAAVAEANTARFAEGGGAGVVLRFGQFYGPGSTHSKAQLRMAKTWHVGPSVGDPDGFVSSIHADDVGSAVVAALRAPSGIYNVDDDEPMRRRDFYAVFAEALGRRKLHDIGKAAARLGGKSAQGMARSARMSNAAFKAATGWQPQVASVRVGWPKLIAAETGR